MAVQYAVTTRNNRLDEVTADSGVAAWLQVWDGALPATPVTAPAGTLLASMALSNPIAPAAASNMQAVCNYPCSSTWHRSADLVLAVDHSIRTYLAHPCSPIR